MIPASYAEWIEQSGANIVPIPYTLEKDEIAALLRQLNGLILPGGGTTVFGKSSYEFYRQRVYFALDTAKQINEEGIHFPVWGTCMGFEQIINWASGYTIWPTRVSNYHIDRRIHWDYKVKYFFSERIEFGTNDFRESSEWKRPGRYPESPDQLFQP
jgi:gamma-glutamyl-gamma-aminobutyrate hydrolase PuuD